MTKELLAKCDPGIRSTLEWLWAHNYITSDSGDGRTKLEPGSGYDPADIIPVPHVVIGFAALEEVLDRCQELYRQTQRVSTEYVSIEATFSWPDMLWTVLFLPSPEWIAALEANQP